MYQKWVSMVTKTEQHVDLQSITKMARSFKTRSASGGEENSDSDTFEVPDIPLELEADIGEQ
jgi:hypothetical protein